GYVFPDPALLVRVSTDKKRATYIYTWLRFQPDLLFRLSKSTFKVTLIKNQMWRDFLLFGDSKPVGTATNASIRREQLQIILGDCLHFAGVTFGDQTTVSLEWKGHQINKDELPDKSVVHKIIWELNELNFRFELTALN
ncbi:hypothetical protein BDN72DRAFT_732034, partial [Pluteus cervinus]